MGVIEWNPEWDTGIRKIDDPHRELFRRVEALMAAIHGDRAQVLVPDTLAFLAEYVEAHFQEEEAEMAATGYSGLAAHRAIHEDMRARVAALLDLDRRNPGSVADPVVDFLTDWLIHHINGEDRRMARYLLATSPQRYEARA